jgi:predicted amidohydrolase
MDLIGVQTDIEWEDRDTNFARVREMLSGVRISKGSLLVLPEMFSVGFSFNERKSVDTRRETEHFLLDLARQHACHVIGGMATRIENHEPDGCGAANELLVAGPSGEILGTYRKLHPFSLVGEGSHHAAGECVSLVECGGFQVAPFICYDLRFPEAFRIASSLGAEILVVIANWPSARIDHWTTLLKARAIENQAYVVGVNRTGTDPSHIYPGKSIIVDPMGRVLAEAGSAPCLVRAKADMNLLLDWRAAFPALRDRREDLAANVLENIEESHPPKDLPIWCQP